MPPDLYAHVDAVSQPWQLQGMQYSLYRLTSSTLAHQRHQTCTYTLTPSLGHGSCRASSQEVIGGNIGHGEVDGDSG